MNLDTPDTNSAVWQWVLAFYDEINNLDESIVDFEESSKDLSSKIGYVAAKCFGDNDSKILLIDTLIEKLNEYFNGNILAALKSSVNILLEGLLIFAVSEECFEREKAVEIIMKMDNDIQFTLMTIIQGQMAIYASDEIVESVEEIIENNNLMVKHMEESLCMECDKKQIQVSTLISQQETMRQEFIVLENKLKNEIASESHKLIDAELTIIEKDRLIETKIKELNELSSRIHELEIKVSNEKNIFQDLQNLQDKIDVLQPQAERLHLAETQLEKVKEKLDELKGVKTQLQAESAAHVETYNKFVIAEQELGTLRKAKVQLEEYRSQVAELTIQTQELTIRLNEREALLARLKDSYNNLTESKEEHVLERLQLVNDLQATNDLLREASLLNQNGIGDGINEFNPVLMHELDKLRNENQDLRSKLDLSSLESLEKMEKDIADQKSINSSLQSKLVSTKDQLKSALHTINNLELQNSNLAKEFKVYRREQEESWEFQRVEVEALKFSHTSQVQYLLNKHDNILKLHQKGHNATISELSTRITQLDEILEEATTDLKKVNEENNLNMEIIIQKDQHIEELNMKRKIESEEYFLEAKKLKEFHENEITVFTNKHTKELQLLQSEHEKVLLEEEDKLRVLQVDLEDERIKRRRIEREKKVLDAELHRCKSQLQSSFGGGGTGTDVDQVLSEMKVMQQELEGVKNELTKAKTSGYNSVANMNGGNSTSNSETNSNNSKALSSRPRRTVNKPVEVISTSNPTNFVNYMEINEVNDRKLEQLVKEKRELLAKNLEGNKERSELSQKILVYERELTSLKSKVTKLTLEKERLERTINKNSIINDENINVINRVNT